MSAVVVEMNPVRDDRYISYSGGYRVANQAVTDPPYPPFTVWARIKGLGLQMAVQKKKSSRIDFRRQVGIEPIAPDRFLCFYKNSRSYRKPIGDWMTGLQTTKSKIATLHISLSNWTIDRRSFVKQKLRHWLDWWVCLWGETRVIGSTGWFELFQTLPPLFEMKR